MDGRVNWNLVMNEFSSVTGRWLPLFRCDTYCISPRWSSDGIKQIWNAWSILEVSPSQRMLPRKAEKPPGSKGDFSSCARNHDDKNLFRAATHLKRPAWFYWWGPVRQSCFDVLLLPPVPFGASSRETFDSQSHLSFSQRLMWSFCCCCCGCGCCFNMTWIRIGI